VLGKIGAKCAGFLIQWCRQTGIRKMRESGGHIQLFKMSGQGILGYPNDGIGAFSCSGKAACCFGTAFASV
jgi:hypothetical protein